MIGFQNPITSAATKVAIIGLSALVLLAGIGCGVQSWRLHSLRADLAQANASVTACKADLRETDSANEDFAEKQAGQNAAVDAFAGECAAKADGQAVSAQQALKKPPRVPITSTDMESMNQWLETY